MEDTCADIRGVHLPFDVDKVLPQCHDCVRSHMKRYEKFTTSTGKSVAGKFLVPCTGIPKNPVNPMLRASCDDEVWDDMVAVKDIVRWAARYLELRGEPWIARWYQEQVLRCTSRRKVLRIARRTGKTDLVCIEICYYLFVNEGTRIIVAGPQKTHTEEIITRVRNFIHANPALADMVVRDVSAPYYEIKLAGSDGQDGSRLRGFAAGSKGKKEGLALRGQDADRIYLEEMDYIDESAITGAVLPILQTNPDTTIIGFSTPSGFQTPYYKLCTENPYYVEFHYNYKVLPHWHNVEMERSSFTEEDWTHEYLAEWGSSEQGVYKPAYIDSALQHYKYGEHTRMPTWRYCIGTDWNETHGTEIVVLGFNTLTSKFQIVDAECIPKSEFTQLSGVQALLDMNKKWRPSFVYIDAGHGSTNYELLKKTAYDQRRKDGDRVTAKLTSILHKYDSGAAILTQDPISHEERRVPAKPFMVNASVRLFEQNRISISSADHVLEKQLRNYIVERMTPTKVPVYGLQEPKVGDHRLDALNLAIVAFQLQFDDLHKVNIVTDCGPGLDPRTMQLTPRPDLDSMPSRPEDRRLDAGVGIYQQGLAHISGRPDGNGVQTNRAGWESDREPEEMAKYLQRKRSRGSVRRERPRRSNI